MARWNAWWWAPDEWRASPGLDEQENRPSGGGGGGPVAHEPPEATPRVRTTLDEDELLSM